MSRRENSKPLIAIIFVLVCYILYSRSVESHVPAAHEVLPGKREDKIGSEDARRSAQRIAILTMNSRETTYDIVSLSNKFSYANKHNYDLKVDFEGPGFWHKLNMIENAIKLDRYDWLWWIDFDTLITNTTIKIEDIVKETLDNHPKPETVRMILTPDCFPLNAGSMIFRASPDVIVFLNLVRECNRVDEHRSEQDCMRDVLGKNEDLDYTRFLSKEWAKRAVIIQQWKMNAFPDEIPCCDQGRCWHEGDFVIHFAGAWAHVKHTEDPIGYLMEKYRRHVK